MLISTYQAGYVVAINAAPEQHSGVVLSPYHLPHAMGIAVDESRMAVAGIDQVWLLTEPQRLAPRLDPPGTYDRALLPRESRYCPATPGGLSFAGDYGFVGLSRICETSTFGGTPLAPYHDRLVCGIGVIDLRTGATVAMLSFDSTVEEIFDVQIVPDTRAVSLGNTGTDGQEIWLLPAPTDGGGSS